MFVIGIVNASASVSCDLPVTSARSASATCNLRATLSPATTPGNVLAKS